MKVTKRRIWMLGILMLVVMIAVVSVNRGGGDELTLHLVDAKGRPTSCAVNVVEYRPIYMPVWLELYLQNNYRWFRRWYYDPKPKRSSRITHGSFRIRRIADPRERLWYAITIRRDGFQASNEVELSYHATTNVRGEIRLAWLGIASFRVEIAPGQTEVTVPVQLQTAGENSPC
jgi:hypothetical protein